MSGNHFPLRDFAVRKNPAVPPEDGRRPDKGARADDLASGKSTALGGRPTKERKIALLGFCILRSLAASLSSPPRRISVGMSSSTLPPLLPHPSAPSSSVGLPRDWKSLIATQPLVSNEFTSSISHHPTENATAHFTSAKFNAGSTEWALSLVGYSIGRRPYYEALLSTIKKTWSLKGTLSLLTLDEGFFLLKFNNREDYDMAWTGGPWFFFGKPFILQKWTPEFVPVREEFPSIPLWIKIKNFPLSCWTPEGISKIASCVGIPLAVDALTAAKTRLTFARVCVQVCSNSPLPDEIYYTVDGKVFPLSVLYDWKPTHCSFCNSIMHASIACPKNPNPQPPKAEPPKTRGRSSSRKPRNPNPAPRLNIPKPPANPLPEPIEQPAAPIALPTTSTSSSQALVPNLNNPTTESPPISPISKHKPASILDDVPQKSTHIAITNKFAILSDQNDHNSTLILNCDTFPFPSHDQPIDAGGGSAGSSKSLLQTSLTVGSFLTTAFFPWRVPMITLTMPLRAESGLNGILTLFNHEKAGGLALQDNKLTDFQNLIYNIGAHELSSVGHFFTWFNQRTDNPIHIKLDRMLVNDAWLDRYPNSFYTVDDPYISDHSPIVVQQGVNTNLKHRFQFKNYWVSKPEFWDELISTFSQKFHSSPIHSFYHKLKTLKLKIKSKSWASSTSLKRDINELNQKQNTIYSQLQVTPLDPELNQALKLINQKLADRNEEWADWTIQRAKAKWMTCGEDDLKFLYSKINVRHNFNLIKAISTGNGILNNHNDISLAIIQHFQILFNTPSPTSNNRHKAPTLNKLPTTLIPQLVGPISVDEIKNVIFSSPNHSTPGPDGYTFEFYKSSWHIIGRQLCEAIWSFFNTGTLPKQAKATAIVLIPKKPHANNISDYRPISLCNTFYKIIAKILANRLREVMPYIIHPSQAGFIHERIISDNVLLASDILLDFNVKDKEKMFCAKYDIHKAFDTISRDFIINRMIDKGFPPLFISWIKGCIYDIHFSVAINGALEGFFNSTSDLRQGCPLSPYLFCLAMDSLSDLFEEAASNHSFHGINTGNVSISHLLYADDLLVFGRASIHNALSLNNILEDFAAISGLHVNPSKSTLLISNNVHNEEAISETLNIPLVHSAFKYLGIPIFSKRLKKSDFQPLIQKIQVSLEGWKARNLSLAGRFQYLKHTIFNILAYWIRSTIIPKGCSKVINSMCSKFLYHGDIHKKKLHVISWKNTCLPKHCGGLGLPTIESLYYGFGCSLIWRFYNSKSYLFKWWKAKYISFWNSEIKKKGIFWNFICGVAAKLPDSFHFSLNDNCSLTFFWEPWCFGSSIADRLKMENLDHLIYPHNLAMNSVLKNGIWLLPQTLPSHIVEIIKKVPISGIEGDCHWTNKSKPGFKTFHNCFFSDIQAVPWHKLVWHKHYALRFSLCTWMVFKNGLKTADNLILRGLTVNPTCTFCNTSEENHMHLFFECDFTFNLLLKLFPYMNCMLLRPNLAQPGTTGYLATLLTVYLPFLPRSKGQFFKKLLNGHNSTLVICNVHHSVSVEAGLVLDPAATRANSGSSFFSADMVLRSATGLW
ncbi:uncharacterized protein LOC110109654 [Dendrobium catenatum]|uniref:uncharacterized protein LOC110109654 n=1 Tax=Dendrobium catenatum TaxID=906689 RepID=UPI00109F445D|nr:uncharacterized protein LOC110109654 [Dendrobium catenatum]